MNPQPIRGSDPQMMIILLSNVLSSPDGFVAEVQCDSRSVCTISIFHPVLLIRVMIYTIMICDSLGL